MKTSIDVDLVLKYLMEINLAQHETEFRAVLDTVCQDSSNPSEADLCVATVAVLMQMAGLPWPVMMHVVSRLKKRTLAQLKEDAVAILNGSHLLVPGDGRVIVVDLATMREVSTMPEQFVSMIFSCAAICEKLSRVLPGPSISMKGVAGA